MPTVTNPRCPTCTSGKLTSEQRRAVAALDHLQSAYLAHAFKLERAPPHDDYVERLINQARIVGLRAEAAELVRILETLEEVCCG